MRDLIEGWGGEAVVTRFDRDSGTWFLIALHDSTLGMPVGGCRMRVYPSPDDALLDAMRLAEGMTYKWASNDVPFGGAKAVLAVPEPLNGADREGVLRRFGRLLHSLNGSYAAGVDLGTTPADMQILAEESRHVLGILPSGEAIDPGPYTALGVFAGIKVVLSRLFGSDDPGGRSVLIQGLGDVGLPLARMLHEAAAELMVCDVDAAKVSAVAEELSARVVAAEDMVRTACDVFAPCATGAVLNPETVPQLECGAVAGSANNQLGSAADADALHGRGVLYAPDYVVNAGGAIAFGLMYRGLDEPAVIRTRILRIAESLDEIFRQADESGESPERAARRKAEHALASSR
jgi:leucine dehydrogenase